MTETVMIADNVWMVQFFQNIGLKTVTKSCHQNEITSKKAAFYSLSFNRDKSIFFETYNFLLFNSLTSIAAPTQNSSTREKRKTHQITPSPTFRSLDIAGRTDFASFSWA